MSDFEDIRKLQKRLEDTRNTLHRLAPLVGVAKQIRDYDSDRRKNLLAMNMVSFLKAGHSATSAEAMARADSAYEMGFDGIARQRQDAEKTIAEWDAAFASYEAARSILSVWKETVKL
jgi:hypothetical protein